MKLSGRGRVGKYPKGWRLRQIGYLVIVSDTAPNINQIYAN